MSTWRQLLSIVTICGIVCCTPLASGWALAQTAPQLTPTSAQPTAAQVQVDLFRGLADIFSRGMDALTDKLNRQGYSARV